jgi:membrane-bound inhibitor of C-type lysozyme
MNDDARNREREDYQLNKLCDVSSIVTAHRHMVLSKMAGAFSTHYQELHLYFWCKGNEYVIYKT